MAGLEKLGGGSPRGAKNGARVRARKACKLCNSRRVRCNVMEKQPCANCELVRVPCELIASRRGKYIRYPGIHSNGTAAKQRNNLDGSAQHLLGMPQSTSPAYPQSFAHVAHKASETLPAMNAPPSRSINSLDTCVATPDSNNTVFLGESNPLTTLTGSPGPRSPSITSHIPGGPAAEKTALCYPISHEISARAAKIAATTTSKAASMEYVTSQGAFTFSPPSVCEYILRSYFAWFHPCFPIVVRDEIASSYATNTLSPLLFQALLFVGASYCPSHIIAEMRFKDRHVAKSHFYERAKLLYDAEWEDNMTIVVQALFLMSFWRAGPLNEKDVRHWLGAATSLAQTRGFHRYTKSSTTNKRQARLRKKIWWSLYVRDRQCNASLGLPSHIRDEDCDVPMLEHEDFADEGSHQLSEIFGFTTLEHESYAIHMAKLATLLGKIVHTEFAPRPGSSIGAQRSSLKDQLQHWKVGLPIEMGYTGSEEPTNLWSNMLLLAYNTDQHPSIHAATTIFRIIEDMLSQNTLQYSQIHLIASLFSALCIQVTTLCSSPSGSCARKFAEQRAQVCILGLKELQKSWDVNNWVLQLFFSLLDESTKSKLHINEFSEPSHLESTKGPERKKPSEMVTPAPSENQIRELEVRRGIRLEDQDFALKMSGAIGEGYAGMSSFGAPFYGLPPETFNFDFHDEDVSQYFGGNAGFGGSSVGQDGFDTRGVGFLESLFMRRMDLSISTPLICF